MKVRTGDLLAIGAVLGFLLLSAARLYPFSNMLDGIIKETGDDWSVYAQSALDVKRHGLLMPSIHGPYFAPASFLYIYFLAACFTLFGESSVPVFLIQGVLLGLSVGLAYWTFRDKMSRSKSLLFLVTASAFAVVDVSNHYTFRFLGENLAIFTVALFFYLFIRGLDRNRLGLILAAAAIMGLSVLIRPNLLVFAVAVMLIALRHFLTTSPSSDAVIRSLLFIVVLVTSMSFLAIRNHAVSGRWLFLPTQGTSANFLKEWHPVPASVDLSGLKTNTVYTRLHASQDVAAYAEFVRQQPLSFTSYYLKKIAFCLGFLPVCQPAYQYRPHWMLMWAGCAVYLWRRLRDSMKLLTWELTVLWFLPCYYGVLVLTAPVANYGFRMLIPATNIVLACAFLAVDRVTGQRAVFSSSWASATIP